MRKKHLKQGLVVLAAAAFGFLVAKGVEATESRYRVFEMRTYVANEGKFEAMHARFRNHTLKLFEKHGIQNVGYWVPQEAPASQNTMIYIVAHKSREAAKVSWNNFRNDPEWRKVQQASEADGRLVARIEAVYLDPTDYSPMK